MSLVSLQTLLHYFRLRYRLHHCLQQFLLHLCCCSQQILLIVVVVLVDLLHSLLQFKLLTYRPLKLLMHRCLQSAQFLLHRCLLYIIYILFIYFYLFRFSKFSMFLPSSKRYSVFKNFLLDSCKCSEIFCGKLLKLSGGTLAKNVLVYIWFFFNKENN